MEKIIKMDLSDKKDLLDKYNSDKVSGELIKYIINYYKFISKKDKIKIIINKKCDMEQNCTELITEALKEEYIKSLKIKKLNNIKQIWLFIIGALFIFLSTIVTKAEIWREILLIVGWVPIWEMVDLELFTDTEEKRKRKVLEKLLQSEIIENEQK